MLDDVLSLNDPTFSKHLDQIYPSELEITETTPSTKSTSYLGLFLEIDQMGKLVSKIYDKLDNFNFTV